MTDDEKKKEIQDALDYMTKNIKVTLVAVGEGIIECADFIQQALQAVAPGIQRICIESLEYLRDNEDNKTEVLEEHEQSDYDRTIN